MAAKPQASAVSTNESISPGPAPGWCSPPAAIWPTLLKMAAPTMAPTPRRVRSNAVSERRRVVPPSASFTASVTGLRRRRAFTGWSAPAPVRAAFGLALGCGSGGGGSASGRDQEASPHDVLAVVAQPPLADLLHRAGGGLDVDGAAAGEAHRAHRTARLDVDHRPHRLGPQRAAGGQVVRQLGHVARQDLVVPLHHPGPAARLEAQRVLEVGGPIAVRRRELEAPPPGHQAALDLEVADVAGGDEHVRDLAQAGDEEAQLDVAAGVLLGGARLLVAGGQRLDLPVEHPIDVALIERPLGALDGHAIVVVAAGQAGAAGAPAGIELALIRLRLGRRGAGGEQEGAQGRMPGTAHAMAGFYTPASPVPPAVFTLPRVGRDRDGGHNESIRRTKTIFVLHLARLGELRKLEVPDRLHQALLDGLVVEGAAHHLDLLGLARGLDGDQHLDGALEGAVVLLVQHVLVALAGRGLALLQEQVDLVLLVGRHAP